MFSYNTSSDTSVSTNKADFPEANNSIRFKNFSAFSTDVSTGSTSSTGSPSFKGSVVSPSLI